MGAIVVTGIPGVGKTTVMEAAAKEKDLKIAVYGSVMFEVAKEKGYVDDRDAMRRMPAERQKEVQRHAGAKIAAMGDVIVDTHCTIKTPTGFLPGLPAWVLEELRPSTIVLVEADADEIAGRRAGDGTRKRDEESLAEIDAHQEWNRRFAASYATLTGATVHTVYNHDGAVEAAIRQVLPVVA